jgi:hypothetical protein
LFIDELAEDPRRVLVSIVDQRTERRYRTLGWPDRWMLITVYSSSR